MDGKTPGQAAYEVSQARLSPKNRIAWEKLHPLHREQREAEAQAAIEAVNPTAEDYDAAAEIMQLRELVREILAEIELGTLGQHTPQATARTLARTAEWRKRAGLLREAVPAEPHEHAGMEG